jgi:hypothetical protein
MNQYCLCMNQGDGKVRSFSGTERWDDPLFRKIVDVKTRASNGSFTLQSGVQVWTEETERSAENQRDILQEAMDIQVQFEAEQEEPSAFGINSCSSDTNIRIGSPVRNKKSRNNNPKKIQSDSVPSVVTPSDSQSLNSLESNGSDFIDEDEIHTGLSHKFSLSTPHIIDPLQQNSSVFGDEVDTHKDSERSNENSIECEGSPASSTGTPNYMRRFEERHKQQLQHELARQDERQAQKLQHEFAQQEHRIRHEIMKEIEQMFAPQGAKLQEIAAYQRQLAHNQVESAFLRRDLEASLKDRDELCTKHRSQAGKMAAVTRKLNTEIAGRATLEAERVKTIERGEVIGEIRRVGGKLSSDIHNVVGRQLYHVAARYDQPTLLYQGTGLYMSWGAWPMMSQPYDQVMQRGSYAGRANMALNQSVVNTAAIDQTGLNADPPEATGDVKQTGGSSQFNMAMAAANRFRRADRPFVRPLHRDLHFTRLQSSAWDNAIIGVNSFAELPDDKEEDCYLYEAGVQCPSMNLVVRMANGTEERFGHIARYHIVAFFYRGARIARKLLLESSIVKEAYGVEEGGFQYACIVLNHERAVGDLASVPYEFIPNSVALEPIIGSGLQRHISVLRTSAVTDDPVLAMLKRPSARKWKWLAS